VERPQRQFGLLPGDRDSPGHRRTPLESNTNLAERMEKVVAAWKDPARFVRKSSWD
jgi:hypothetical protein